MSISYTICTISVAYLLATISYFVITRFMRKPLEESLTEEQQMIKSKSTKVRGAVFGISFAAMIFILMIMRPKLY